MNILKKSYTVRGCFWVVRAAGGLICVFVARQEVRGFSAAGVTFDICWTATVVMVLYHVRLVDIIVSLEFFNSILLVLSGTSSRLRPPFSLRGFNRDNPKSVRCWSPQI